jgi:hypothetical protein
MKSAHVAARGHRIRPIPQGNVIFIDNAVDEQPESPHESIIENSENQFLPACL